ncbi:hypothetical protein [Porcipelethomonas sp.]|uniref:hypothetical protein n=1 Tax=Porcipelethomonas sp. TaxID=2981675 RepID=UPI003EF3668E
MILKKLRDRIFRKKPARRTYVIDSWELSGNRSFEDPNDFWKDEDKSIFEIRDSFTMNGLGTVIYGRVKRGFFSVNDKIAICSPVDTKEKLEGVIVKITTSLVEVNKINCGFESDILISVCGDSSRIFPGDRAYKKCKTGGIKNAVQ